jgi:hypothetical protein
VIRPTNLLLAGAALAAALVWTFFLPNPPPPPVAGIPCQTMEGQVLHYHVHLQLWRDGQALIVSEGIGRAGNCYYWLHTHTADGVVHIESPEKREFTLGQLFQIWDRNPWGNGPIDKVKGLTLWLKREDDKAFQKVTTSWMDVTLSPHAILALGTGDFGPKAFTFPEGL